MCPVFQSVAGVAEELEVCKMVSASPTHFHNVVKFKFIEREGVVTDITEGTLVFVEVLPILFARRGEEMGAILSSFPTVLLPSLYSTSIRFVEEVAWSIPHGARCHLAKDAEIV